MSAFPRVRLRRYRQRAAVRRLFDRPLPAPERFLYPVFVRPGQGVREPIAAMPGQFRHSLDQLEPALRPVVQTGIGGVLLFGLVEDDGKTEDGARAADPQGIVPQAVHALRQAFGQDLMVATDVCLCAYTTHGHCGPLDGRGRVDNDAALPRLAETAVAHAQAGADLVAPSAMMDGQVAAIRDSLDRAGHTDCLLMSYSTKFASSMYGPFREAAHSAPGTGDRQGYQASARDLRTALRESALDEVEGADLLMVKPSLFYLDLIVRLRKASQLPIAAYNVSGEYSMLIAAAERGWGDLRAMVRESVAALDRAGADLIISYWCDRYQELLA